MCCCCRACEESRRVVALSVTSFDGGLMVPAEALILALVFVVVVVVLVFGLVYFVLEVQMKIGQWW